MATKTTIEMAREAAGDDWGLFQEYMPEIHRLAELVRADERARMATDKSKEAMKLALEALELAQDNLRDHGDNCFLHDEGEYDRCFCGKDSLSNHLQSVVEKLDEALAEQPAQQTCNCRWEGEVQVQQCTLHEAHVAAIHEWAERAKVAEAKLKEQPAQQEPVECQYGKGGYACCEGGPCKADEQNNAPQPAQQEFVTVPQGCVVVARSVLKKLGIDDDVIDTIARPPAQRQPLTDEVIWLEYQRFWPFHPAEEPTLAKDIAKFAHAIEAKLKERNT